MNTVVSRTDYLPFGVRMTGNGLTESTTARSAWFGFSGKENELWNAENSTFHWLRGERYQHFGARYYDPVSCTWTGIDPLAESYYNISPYSYCAGDPVNKVDPDGKDWYKKDNGEFEYYEGKLSKTEMKKRHYSKHMGYSLVDNNTYYSLLGYSLIYNNLGRLYEKIDQLLIKYAEDAKRKAIPDNPFDTENILMQSVDFFIEGLQAGHYRFIYRGKYFSSEESGTFFNAISQKQSFRSVQTHGDSHLIIKGFPDYQRNRHGIGQNNYDASYVGYFIVGGPKNGVAFGSLQIQFDYENAVSFLQSFSNLFGINCELR